MISNCNDFALMISLHAQLGQHMHECGLKSLA